MRAGGALALVLALLATVAGQGGSRAAEELLAAPLTPQSALVVLEVQTLAERGAALHRLAAAQGVRRLHLSLVQGRWDEDVAVPAWLGLPPPGLEVWAEFEAGVDEGAAFQELTQALGGLLCTTLASLPAAGLVAAPAVGWFGELPVQRHAVYAAIPEERLCTENLAAWLALSPEGGMGGGSLASALPLHAVVASPFRGLELAIRVVDGAADTTADGAACHRQQVVVRQTLTAVVGIGPAAANGSLSLQSLVGASLGGLGGDKTPSIYLLEPAAAPVAAADAVEGFWSRAKGCQRLDTRGGGLHACSPAQLRGLDLNAIPEAAPEPPGGQALRVASRIAGSPSSGEGRLVVSVRARGAGLLHVIQAVPWQLPVWLHTLRIEVDGQALPLTSPAIVWHNLAPADPASQRPALLELLLSLPEGGAPVRRVVLSAGFRKELLGAFQYSPDASRGVDVPPAVATLVPSACAGRAAGEEAGAGAAPLLARLSGGCGQQRRHGTPQLVLLPIPDFSMPFNVVSFTSTVLAIYCGGLAKTLLRSGAEAEGGTARPAWRNRLRRVLLVLLASLTVALLVLPEFQRHVDSALQALVLGRLKAGRDVAS